ncbi:MAG TPA: D-amino acid aminotransferase [Burkholderiales bacterium]|nr:D-amino acid aminotransferase [Burkholderiales bacterium]
MPLEEARIPVLDRGFIFGDGVYEVVPSYSRKPFRLKEHLKRLQSNLDSIRLKNPHTDAQWARLFMQLVEQNQGEDQYIYLHITRGPAKRDHAFPVQVQPTVFMMSTPLQVTPRETLKTGVAAITAQDNRWLRCDIKAISLLPNVLLRQLAVECGAAETVLIRDGFLTEGAASNIFVVKNGVVLAPPKSHLILPGITYDVVLELAAAHSIPCEVRAISETEVRTAQELWMTSSGKEILAITNLNGQPVGDGKPGKVFWRMFELYQNFKASAMRQSEAQAI